MSPGRGTGAALSVWVQASTFTGYCCSRGGKVAGNCLFDNCVWRVALKECWEQTVMRAAVRSALSGDTVNCLVITGVRSLEPGSTLLCGVPGRRK